nr:immunoglobulin heavy chain junction region [Mus musculus]NSM05648.1 immunoglobulin heavy chain junction region [Mus musculus]NSM05943.1 immunoglobulin heavy chain junction region [Mus musculus]NSM06760.1 immunoglobulin heavy chain junction region [Mus musculus]NSM07126.1 immunoglobulin heavy chain junction region [Mus musculus]
CARVPKSYSYYHFDYW